MTMNQACSIAMRELGLTEEEINERLKIANLLAPNCGAATVIEGEERYCINSIKAMYRRANPESMEQLVKQSVIKAVKEVFGAENVEVIDCTENNKNN